MTDPVTNAEIEDVLSSIRRLVSDEPVASKSRKPSEKPANDSFLLTPALRVTEKPDTEDASAEEASGEAAEAREDIAEQPAEGAAEDTSDAGGEDQAPWTASADEDVDLTEIAGTGPAEDLVDEAALDEAAAAEDGAESTEPVAANRDGADQGSGVLPTLTLEQRIAELEAAIEQAPGEWEPDGSETALTDETAPIGTAKFGEEIAAEPAPDADDVAAQVGSEPLAAQALPDDAKADAPETDLTEDEPEQAEASGELASTEQTIDTADLASPDDDPEGETAQSGAEVQEDAADVMSPVSEERPAAEADVQPAVADESLEQDAEPEQHSVGLAGTDTPEEPSVTPEAGFETDVEMASSEPELGPEATQSVEPEPEATQSVEPEPVPDTETEAAHLAETEPELEPELEAEAVHPAEPEPEPETEAAKPAEPELESVHSADAEPEPETETEATLSEGAEPELEAEAAHLAEAEAEDIAPEPEDEAAQAAVHAEPSDAETGNAREERAADNVYAAAFAHHAEPQQETPETDTKPAPQGAAGVDEGAGDAAFDDDPDDEDEAAFDLYSDAAVLDEEALREMVSSLVREELQGVLGERITRNVRRLVRREIQRAMAVREFE